MGVRSVRRYVARRCGIAALIIYFVVSLSFFLVRLMPGSPVAALEAQLEQEGGITPQQIQQRVQAIYGLSPKAPLWKQYFIYIGHAFEGNLGRSVTNPGETVVHIIAGALPWTLFVVAVALLISFTIGIAVGAIMAAFQHTRVAKVLTFLASFFSSVPNYLLAIVLLYFLADLHHWFPVGGAYGITTTPGLNFPFIASALKHAILPIAAYVITSFGGWALAMKGTAVAVLGEEYVRAAEVRGLGQRKITQSYIGRNSMLPQVTSLALSIGFMFGGSVFIETYFTYPGIGYYLINAVNARDYSLMMGCFILITSSVVICNLLVDFLYPLIDPRIARPGASKLLTAGGGRDRESYGGLPMAAAASSVGGTDA